MTLLRWILVVVTLALSAAAPAAAQDWQTLGDFLIRVRVTPGSAFPAAHSWAVIDSAPKPVHLLAFRDSANEVTFTTRALRVRIAKATAAISFIAPDGRVIAADDPARPVL